MVDRRALRGGEEGKGCGRKVRGAERACGLEEEEESLLKADAVNEGGPWWRSGGCGELAVSRSWAGRLTLHVDQLVHWCWHSFVPCSWSLTVVF